MTIFAEGKEHDRKLAEREKRESKNRARAGDIIARRREILKIKDKLTHEEIDRVLKAESPNLWRSYVVGAPIDEAELQETSRIYGME